MLMKAFTTVCMNKWMNTHGITQAPNLGHWQRSKSIRRGDSTLRKISPLEYSGLNHFCITVWPWRFATLLPRCLSHISTYVTSWKKTTKTYFLPYRSFFQRIDSFLSSNGRQKQGYAGLKMYLAAFKLLEMALLLPTHMLPQFQMWVKGIHFSWNK